MAGDNLDVKAALDSWIIGNPTVIASPHPLPPLRIRGRFRGGLAATLVDPYAFRVFALDHHANRTLT